LDGCHRQFCSTHPGDEHGIARSRSIALNAATNARQASRRALTPGLCLGRRAHGGPELIRWQAVDDAVERRAAALLAAFHAAAG
jgi:hypothetical protein